jgi:hypothetical protein
MSTQLWILNPESSNPLELLETPYITQGGTPTVAYYEAEAVDVEGNSYTVRWDITDNDTEEASEACDWDAFTWEAK